VRALELTEQIGALPRRAHGVFARQNPVGHKIPGDEYRVGIHAVDVIDGVEQQKRLCEFVQVDVAELRDTETVESWRKAWQKDVAVGDLNPVPLTLAPVERQSSARARAPKQEAATRNWRL